MKTFPLKIFIATSFLVSCGPNPVDLLPSSLPESQTESKSTPTTPDKEPDKPSDDSEKNSNTSSTGDIFDLPEIEENTSDSTPEDSSTVVESGTTPLIIEQTDISIVEKTTFNGKIFDLSNAPLDDVKVVARSLNASVPFEAETTTVGGTYSFNSAPAGVQVKITASKDSYTTRSRVEVLKSNKNGDPNANRYDFGTDGSSTFGSSNQALSDSPEVIEVTPGRASADNPTNTAFILTFSEPMDQKSVEDTFSIRAFNTTKLSVDTGASSNTFSGDSTLTTLTNPLIWDKDAFEIIWNGDSSEVTFAFKDEQFLPSDKDSSNVPDYQVVFNTSAGRVIKDSDGNSRDKFHFRLTDSALEESYKFSIKTDDTKPEVIAITAQTAENSGDKGDAIQVTYSEPMILYTRSRNIAGGLEDRSGVSGSEVKAPAQHPNSAGNVTANNVAKNYTVSIVRNGNSIYSGTWFKLGGTVVYDTTDPTHKTVILLPPTQGSLSATVAGAPVNAETISATATLTDGTTTTLSTQPYLTQTSLVADHVGAGANITNSATETLSILYTDGSVESNLNISNPAANTYTALRTSLGALTTGGITDWTLTELQSAGGAGNGNVEANDRLNVTLAANASRNGKTIAHVILNGGVFGTAVLNMANYNIVTSPLNETQGALNTGFDLTGGRLTVTEANGAGGLGVWAAGDTLSLSLGANPTTNNTEIKQLTINPSGIFATSRLNTPTGGFIILPNTPIGSKANLYQPGDTVTVTIAQSVLDPAGNTMDTSKNNAIATAS